MVQPATEDLAPLNIIRTETVISKLPIHKLSKQGEVQLQVIKKNKEGETELYWDVSGSEKHGFPGQLAYKIDTLIINKRIDELGRPLPKLICLGRLQHICEELGLSLSGRTAADVKKALLQNASAFITAKFTYKGNDGSERSLEAGFTRYSIIFTGEKLPGGEKADAVYISLNDPYRETLNNAPVRPLNYDYLKQLSPSAQRFYEIIGYKVYPAIKYNHKQAKLLYSEFCLYSAQNRYYDYDHFKKQMYKIHKPHLDSGYIEKVEYEKTRDANGMIDWMMIYKLGEKAQAEYKAFNSKMVKADPINIKLSKTLKNVDLANPIINKQAQPSALKKTITKEKKSEPSTALKLVQDFHKRARGVDNYKLYAGSKEESQAETLIATYGWEQARYVVSFAIAHARKTSFEMRTFGAIFQYVNDAIAEYKHDEQKKAAQRAQEEATRQVAEQRLQALSKREYKTLYEKIKTQLLSDLPSLTDTETIEALVKTKMLVRLEKS